MLGFCPARRVDSRLVSSGRRANGPTAEKRKTAGCDLGGACSAGRRAVRKVFAAPRRGLRSILGQRYLASGGISRDLSRYLVAPGLGIFLGLARHVMGIGLGDDSFRRRHHRFRSGVGNDPEASSTRSRKTLKA